MTATPARDRRAAEPAACPPEGCPGCPFAAAGGGHVDQLTVAREYDRWLAGRDLRARHMRFLMSVPGAVLVNTPALLLGDVLGLRPHHRLLDLGCGRAAVARILAARVPLETPPIGIDLSRVMLALARADQAGRPPNAAELVRGSVVELPLRDNSVDAAVAAHVIKHLPDPELHAFFREVARVLKPGGRFVLWEFRRTGSRSADAVHRRLLGSRVQHMKLRSFGEIVALSVETGFSRIQLLKRQPFLYPPIPRVAVLYEK
ncbi:MAG TPA: class I SAM-dependent methyltransferase [Dehalococcoidia bacterium]